MKLTLSIFPAAETDVDEAARFIARDNLSAALRFYDSVDSTYSQIRDHPLRWPKYDLAEPRLDDLRKRSVINSPHISSSTGLTNTASKSFGFCTVPATSPRSFRKN